MARPQPATATIRSLTRTATPRNAPVRQGVGPRPRLVEGLVDHGVEGRIAQLDPRDRRLDQLCGRHLALAHQFGETDAVVVGIVIHTVPPGRLLPTYGAASNGDR